MLSEITNTLKQEKSLAKNNLNFAVEYQLNLTDFCIEVADLGQLRMPINDKTSQALLKKSAPAKFGLREKTLLDPAVRDTHEILASQLKVEINNEAFSNMLDHMRDKLGLSNNAKLTAHLHNMLIYGEGQFFKPHQDSEKISGMIATLVVILPSPHIGGDLHIEHNKKSYRFVSEHLNAKEIKCLAFYADCYHEVEKIREGYRVALTYNLVLEPTNNQLAKISNPALEQALSNYFSFSQEDNDEPLNLVYFLDHDYSEHSLNWHLLKGNDAKNAMAFQQAAVKLDLIPHLALVDIHKSWTAEGDEEEPLPEEFIDGSTELTYWVDINNQKLPYERYYISEDEVCWTKDTDTFEPSKTEYEGWMGNYGNTVDYWYRRAAIVLWKKSAQITMDFKLNYTNALKNLLEVTKTDNQQEVLSVIHQAGDYLYDSSYDNNVENNKLLLQIACNVSDAALAESLLSRKTIFCITTHIIDELVELQTCYGLTWCIELFQKWVLNSKQSYYGNPSLFFTNMDGFIHKAFNKGLEIKLLQFLLCHQLILIIAEDKKSVSAYKPIDWRKERSQRLDTAKQFIHSCTILPEDALTKQFCEHLMAYPALYSQLDLAEILLAERNEINDIHQTAYNLLLSHVKKSINQALEKGEPDRADWSIDVKFSCSCEHCKIAQDFLWSKTEIKKVWPINAGYREHISAAIRDYDLPVDLSVEKSGSPHKLVMIKTDQHYQQAKERYEKLLTYSKMFS